MKAQNDFVAPHERSCRVFLEKTRSNVLLVRRDQNISRKHFSEGFILQRSQPYATAIVLTHVSRFARQISGVGVRSLRNCNCSVSQKRSVCQSNTNYLFQLGAAILSGTMVVTLAQNRNARCFIPFMLIQRKACSYPCRSVRLSSSNFADKSGFSSLN